MSLIMIEACQRIESIEFRGRISQVVEDVLCFFLEIFLVRSPHPHEMGQERPLGSRHEEALDGSEMTGLHPVIKETWRFADVSLVTCRSGSPSDAWLGIIATCPYLQRDSVASPHLQSQSLKAGTWVSRL